MFSLKTSVHHLTYQAVSTNEIALVAWASSPLALKGTLQKIADTPGGKSSFETRFKLAKQQRQAVIEPILVRLRRDTEKSDTKLKALIEILDRHTAVKEKAIIFCERRATVVYLKRALAEIRPDINVAATIEQHAESFEMKESQEIEKLIAAFAPQSNDADLSLEGYDVFVSTDAHGVGVNMQDASVVVNYDIDWTPIGPTQRAGRILRFWPKARTVHVYTFVPTLSQSNPLAGELSTISRRWSRLMTRHEDSMSLTDLPVLTKSQEQNVVMSELASEVTIRSGDLDVEQLSNLEISPYYQHTARLQQHRDYASSLPTDLVSAKVYSGRHPAVYVLLQHNSLYYGLIYTLHNKQVRKPEIVKLLDLLQCEESTQVAAVDANEIEYAANECIETWCRQNEIEPEQVLRECTMYLCPKERDGFEHLLSDDSK